MIQFTERTPGSSREDLWELLDSVGLDYYDRLEWLIRTDLRAAIDNLIVERAREETVSKKVENARELKACIEKGQYGDEIIIENISSLGTDSRSCVKMLNRLMHYGIRLKSKQEKINLNVEDYKNWMPVLEGMFQMDEQLRKRQQKKGIDFGEGKRKIDKGRKQKEIDDKFLEEIISRFQKKEIPLEEALLATKLSKSTFYRRIKENQ